MRLAAELLFAGVAVVFMRRAYRKLVAEFPGFAAHPGTPPPPQQLSERRPATSVQVSRFQTSLNLVPATPSSSSYSCRRHRRPPLPVPISVTGAFFSAPHAT